MIWVSERRPGRLIQPFSLRVHTGNNNFLNHPGDIELTGKAKAFRRWIMDEVRSRPFA